MSRREYHRKWREKNGEKIRLKNLEWRLMNPEYAKQYRERPENKQVAKEYQEWYREL